MALGYVKVEIYHLNRHIYTIPRFQLKSHVEYFGGIRFSGLWDTLLIRYCKVLEETSLKMSVTDKYGWCIYHIKMYIRKSRSSYYSKILLIRIQINTLAGKTDVWLCIMIFSCLSWGKGEGLYEKKLLVDDSFS